MPIFVLGEPASSPPFWQSLTSPLITFAGTLVVVWLTNHYASKNLRQQRSLDEQQLRDQWKREDDAEWERQKYEAAEAVKERTTQKRREVCLKAVGAYSRYQTSLATLATKFEDYDYKPLQDLTAGAAQVELVVEPDAARAVRELVSETGKMHMRLMIKHMPLHVLHRERARLEPLQKDSPAVQAQLQKIQVQFDQLVEVFYRDMLLELKSVVPARVRAVTALRKDLELPTESLEALQAYYEADAEATLNMLEETAAAAHRATKA